MIQPLDVVQHQVALGDTRIGIDPEVAEVALDEAAGNVFPVMRMPIGPLSAVPPAVRIHLGCHEDIRRKFLHRNVALHGLEEVLERPEDGLDDVGPFLVIVG